MPPALINEEIHVAEWLHTQLNAITSLNTMAPAGVWIDLIPIERTLPGIRYPVPA